MKTIDNILPKELSAFFESDDYEGYGWIKILSTALRDNDLFVSFSIQLGAELVADHTWQLRVKNCQDYNIAGRDTGEYFTFYSDHPLLWEYTDICTELYINRRALDPAKLFASLYKEQCSLLGDIALMKYLFTSTEVVKHCELENGLFARGPRKVLAHYFECLKAAGCDPYFLEDDIPKHCDGRVWPEPEAPLKLASLGSTHFIGEHFLFSRTKGI